MLGDSKKELGTRIIIFHLWFLRSQHLVDECREGRNNIRQGRHDHGDGDGPGALAANSSSDDGDGQHEQGTGGATSSKEESARARQGDWEPKPWLVKHGLYREMEERGHRGEGEAGHQLQMPLMASVSWERQWGRGEGRSVAVFGMGSQAAAMWEAWSRARKPMGQGAWMPRQQRGAGWRECASARLGKRKGPRRGPPVREMGRRKRGGLLGRIWPRRAARVSHFIILNFPFF